MWRRSQSNQSIWRDDLKKRTRRILYKLPYPIQKWGICRSVIMLILAIWQVLKWLVKPISQIPTWLWMFLAVVFLAGIALWVNDVFQIQCVENLVSKKIFKTIFESAESISITAVAILYFIEAPARKAQRLYEATQVLDTAASGKLPTSYARVIALQDLNQEKFPLKGLDAPKSDLAEIHLPKAKLMKADLRGAILEGSELPMANLSEANLLEARLSGANLQEAELWKATLIKATLRGVDLHKANLAEAKLTNAKLQEANLRAANLYGADLEAANLWGANLRDANLTGANLLNANLEKADLRGASLQAAQLQNARLCETILPDGTISPAKHQEAY